MVFSIYLNETTGGNLRELSNSIVFVFYGLGGVLVNVVSMRWNSFRVYAWLQLVLSVPVLVCLVWIPKTPFFLYMHGNYDEMVNVLTRMARLNDVGDWTESVRPKLLSQIQLLRGTQLAETDSKNAIDDIPQK